MVKMQVQKSVSMSVCLCVRQEGLSALSSSGKILNHIRYKHLLAERSLEQLLTAAEMPPPTPKDRMCPNNQPAPGSPPYSSGRSRELLVSGCGATGRLTDVPLRATCCVFALFPVLPAAARLCGFICFSPPSL